MTEEDEEEKKKAEAEAEADAEAEEDEDEDEDEGVKAGVEADGGASVEGSASGRASWGFPSFARDFPVDAELARLVEAFAAGDYATVRQGAPALAARTTDADVKRAAEVLRARIEPDPTSRVLFGLTAALLVFLMAWWATHDGKQHHEASTSPAKPAVTVEVVK